MVILAVAFVPSIDLHAIEGGHAAWYQFVPWRELAFATAAALSFLLGNKEVRFHLNQFTWTPILEVAALFIGIFLTMIPALAFLGQVAPRLPLNEVTFFLFTGGLSAVLDNAPTYATFYEMASQVPVPPGVELIGTTPPVPESFLVAISLGAVFCGALTYIGNGPNFMVKSVAESRGVEMPSFGGYVLWSFAYLGPILVALLCLFIADGVLATALGAAAALFVVARAVLDLRASNTVDRLAPPVNQ